MSSSPRPRFASVDASFLISLAAGDASCEDAVDFLQRLRLFIFVTPSTCQALKDVALESENSEIKRLANEALSSLSVWGFWIDGLSDVNTFIANEAAKYIQEALNLSVSQCRVITESSINNAVIFLSDDPRFTDIDHNTLGLLLLDRDLSGFPIFDPTTFSSVAQEVINRPAHHSS